MLRPAVFERVKKALPATKPELAERLGVTPGRAQQIITSLQKDKMVEPAGTVVNKAGGLVQRFALTNTRPEPDISMNP